MVRLPPALHRRLRDRARGSGLSLNSLCVHLLEQGVATRSGGSPRGATAVHPEVLDAVERAWRGALVGVALFGSAARGDATEASDVDLLLVLEPGVPIERSLYDRWDEIVASERRPEFRRVSPQFVALPRSARDAGGIWLEVAREGIVLSDRDGRLARLLISLRDLAAEGAVLRRTVHGHPYWVREGRPR